MSGKSKLRLIVPPARGANQIVEVQTYMRGEIENTNQDMEIFA